jgi:DNA-binding SARP family transcriptional activator
MDALSKVGDTNAALQVYRGLVDLLKEDPIVSPDESSTRRRGEPMGNRGSRRFAPSPRHGSPI